MKVLIQACGHVSVVVAMPFYSQVSYGGGGDFKMMHAVLIMKGCSFWDL